VWCAVFLGPISYILSTLSSVAAGLGFTDALQNTLCFTIVSSLYTDEQERMCGFAVSKFTNAVASGLAFFILPYLGYKAAVGIGIIVLIIACVCVCGLYLSQSYNLFAKLKEFSLLKKDNKRRHEILQDEL